MLPIKAKKYYPAAQLGAGMKFYLNPRISLRADLKMLLHQWVDLRNYSPRSLQIGLAGLRRLRIRVGIRVAYLQFRFRVCCFRV